MAPLPHPGAPLMKTCARERCPPTAVLKAMLAKGSVKFGLGMKLGRMEGAKEARASHCTPHRLATLVAPRPSAPPPPTSSAAQTSSPHTAAALPGSKAPRRLATLAPRATRSARPTHSRRLLPASQTLGSLAM